MSKDPYDLSNLRLEPQGIKVRRRPAKVQKRESHVIVVPMWWYERLTNPLPATRCTIAVALHVLYLNFRSYGEPFKLPNGTLEHDGISHDSKTRALKDLERRGLITIQGHKRKSPIIHVHLTQPCVS